MNAEVTPFEHDPGTVNFAQLLCSSYRGGDCVVIRIDVIPSACEES